MGRFHTSLEYNRYLGKTVISRPDDQLLPRLDEQDDQIYVAPGEVYCRFRDANGQLCSHVGRFSRRAYLVNHYQAEHKLTVADNVTKSHSNRGGDSIVGKVLYPFSTRRCNTDEPRVVSGAYGRASTILARQRPTAPTSQHTNQPVFTSSKRPKCSSCSGRRPRSL
ncbi:hypothetical protein NCS56_01259700 [Fusarium sp. Ph1]|nr:hypothetical protein NCS56_01259700 [Fusarium sp. Ph1]